jgi:cyclopropane fatty-acyl-phospholipid synthase-like methyltransferase
MTAALFDRAALSYDAWYETDLGRAVDEVEATLVSRLFVPSGSRVLDVGCGTGLYTARLARRGLDVTAVDSSGTMLDRARRRLAREGLHAAFVQSDIREVVGSLGRFDGILSVTAMEFIANPATVVEALFAALAPGASLVVGVVAGRSPWSEFYGAVARARPESVFARARFPTVDEVSRWAGSIPAEIATALRFPPETSSYAEAMAIEARRGGEPGFIAARWRAPRGW